MSSGHCLRFAWSPSNYISRTQLADSWMNLKNEKCWFKIDETNKKDNQNKLLSVDLKGEQTNPIFSVSMTDVGDPKRGKAWNAGI